METIYNVLPPLFIHVNIATDGGTYTYEDGILKMTFEIPFTKEEIDEEIQRISAIRHPEYKDQPQHCLDAIKYLQTLKIKLGWQ